YSRGQFRLQLRQVGRWPNAAGRPRSAGSARKTRHPGLSPQPGLAALFSPALGDFHARLGRRRRAAPGKLVVQRILEGAEIDHVRAEVTAPLPDIRRRNGLIEQRPAFIEVERGDKAPASGLHYLVADRGVADDP